MEFFLPSVLLLLIAAAVVFFVIPRFGPAFLAIVSAILLAFGIYKHYTTFGAEYRLSTWQLGLTAYAPYVLVAGLLLAIGIYLLYLLPSSMAANTAATAPLASIPIVSTLANMPAANTATNSVTAGINKALNTVANTVTNTVTNIIPGNNKKNNNKGIGFPFSQV